MTTTADHERGVFSHDDLVTLTAYMAGHHYSAADIAHAVEKPWHYTEILDAARLAQDD